MKLVSYEIGSHTVNHFMGGFKTFEKTHCKKYNRWQEV